MESNQRQDNSTHIGNATYKNQQELQQKTCIPIHSTNNATNNTTNNTTNIPKSFLSFLEEQDIDLDEYFRNFYCFENRFFRVRPAESVSELDVVESIENHLKLDPNASKLESTAERMVRNVSWLPCFYKMPLECKIADTLAFQNSLVFPMDISSGIAVHALDVKETDQVLDLCCSPGAKMAMIHDLLGSLGTVTGCDISKQRLANTRAIIKKYKLPRARLFCADGTLFNVAPPSRIGSLYLNSNQELDSAPFVKPFHASKLLRTDLQTSALLYDKVIVDAECTHDGSLIHIKKLQNNQWNDLDSRFLEPKRIASIRHLQLSLLQNGFKMLKKGGILVYSTCSFSRYQNEEVVLAFLESRGSFDVEVESVPFADTFPLAPLPSCYANHLKKSELEKTLRFTPRHSATSGLFVARFRKKL